MLHEKNEQKINGIFEKINETINQKNLKNDLLNLTKSGVSTAVASEAVDLLIENFNKIFGNNIPNFLLLFQQTEKGKHINALCIAVILKILSSTLSNYKYSDKVNDLSSKVVEFEITNVVKPYLKEIEKLFHLIGKSYQ